MNGHVWNVMMIRPRDDYMTVTSRSLWLWEKFWCQWADLFIFACFSTSSSQDQRMTSTAAAAERLKNDRTNNNISNGKSKWRTFIVESWTELMMDINQIFHHSISEQQATQLLSCVEMHFFISLFPVVTGVFVNTLQLFLIFSYFRDVWEIAKLWNSTAHGGG